MILGISPYQFIEVFPHNKSFIPDALDNTRNYNNIDLLVLLQFLL